MQKRCSGPLLRFMDADVITRVRFSTAAPGIQSGRLCDRDRKSHFPMGTLADGDLRKKRIQAHKSFSQLWESGLMGKWQAYQWMQAKFGLRRSDAHIAKFSAYMCGQLIVACEEFAGNNSRLAGQRSGGQRAA